MMSKSGNSTHDVTVASAESTRQAAMVPGVSQATATAAFVTFYRSALASAVTNGLDQGPFIFALQQLRVTP